MAKIQIYFNFTVSVPMDCDLFLMNASLHLACALLILGMLTRHYIYENILLQKVLCKNNIEYYSCLVMQLTHLLQLFTGII